MKEDTQDMPEEIWAFVNSDYRRGWFDLTVKPNTAKCAKYIRADLALQQKPAVLKGERAKALEAFDNVLKNYWGSISLYMSRADRETIKSALQSSAVEDVSITQLNKKLDDLCDSLEEMCKEDMVKFLQSFPNGLRIIEEKEALK